jgi:putative ABC transport system permease protein
MKRWTESLAQDLRYAARTLRKSPEFTLVAVLTLAIGIGATTAVFSVINQLLLRPLPYPDHDRLVALSNVYAKNPEWNGPVSAEDVAAWRADNQVFEKLEFVSGPDIVAMSGAGSGERVGVQHLSAQLLPLLGIKAFMGTLPTDDVAENQGSPGLLISYEFWKRHFGSDPRVLGQSIFVDTFSGPIIAVLEPGFNLFGTWSPEIFLIEAMGHATDIGPDNVRWLFGVGKLKKGVSVQQAQAAMDVTARHLAQAFPERYKDVGVRVEPLQKGLFGDWRNVYYTLFGAVGLVLLIAWANVANLLLVRGDGRRKVIGVRVALGASQWSVVRQIITESVFLSVIGGVCGLILSILAVRLFNLWAPVWYPRGTGFLIDGWVLLFTFGTSVVTGIAFGLIPAYRAVRNNVNECLREGGRSTATVSRHRTRNVLVVSEIALALVLLICAGLMINTVTRILRTNPGFNPEHLLTAEVRLTGDQYMDANQIYGPNLNLIRPSVGEFCRQVLERVRNVPGVEDVALVDWLPLLETAQPASPGFTTTGQGASTRTGKPTVLRQAISSDYFRLMGIPVLRGRGVTEQDTESNAWVVVINDTMARRFWPKQDPVGITMKFDDSPDEKPRVIVGVVGDVKQRSLTRPPNPEAYISYQQLSARTYPGWTEARVHKSLVIRTHAPSKALMEQVRRAISQLAPESAVFGISMVERTVSQSASPWRFLCQLIELFAGIALLLAVIGIYGVISYSIAERTHELGLRMALGAQRWQVVGLVLRQAMVLALIGVGIGLTGSFAATPLLADFLYGVKSHDVMTLSLVSFILIAVTFLASYVPARHATRIDPMQSLRHE